MQISEETEFAKIIISYDGIKMYVTKLYVKRDGRPAVAISACSRVCEAMFQKRSETDNLSDRRSAPSAALFERRNTRNRATRGGTVSRKFSSL